MPSSPCTIIGLRPASRYILEQWWSLAKRNAFRLWTDLINSPTGIFLVTKAVKTHRYATCLSKGQRGQTSQIHIQGMDSMPRNNDDVQLPTNGTNWQIVRNELGFRVHDSGGDRAYTVFIERDASRLFALTDPAIRDAAQRLWTCLHLFCRGKLIVVGHVLRLLDLPGVQRLGIRGSHRRIRIGLTINLLQDGNNLLQDGNNLQINNKVLLVHLLDLPRHQQYSTEKIDWN